MPQSTTYTVTLPSNSVDLDPLLLDTTTAGFFNQPIEPEQIHADRSEEERLGYGCIYSGPLKGLTGLKQ
ncbi:hypothetical protein HPP92_007911 [Vanilla planifolia]|uniref:Uncharacterized protein n=1 Tax=Vanilla planifolia TaxID=51239 RepID=A0A835V9V3_VANPL|nr:hypothetical protein HPP92_007911 [Vanilla planifolia]